MFRIRNYAVGILSGAAVGCAALGCVIAPLSVGANTIDNKNVEEEEVHYTSVKNFVATIGDVYYGTVVGDLFAEIGNKYFSQDEVLYSDVASYTSYASALIEGADMDSAQEYGQVSDKSVEEEVYVEEVIVADCVLSKGKTYSVTEEEYDMLTRLVQCEAGGEDFEGKVLVANVVINRVRSKSFPNTIEGVIFQNRGGSYQFQPASGKINRVTASSDTKKAVDKALAGDDYSSGALYFVSTKYASTGWFDRNLNHLFTHGNHAFYK